MVCCIVDAAMSDLLETTLLLNDGPRQTADVGLGEVVISDRMTLTVSKKGIRATQMPLFR